MAKTEIKLGQRVKDLLTGLEGIVDSKCYQLHGNTRVSIQPIASEGKVPESIWVDEVSAEITDTVGLTERVVAPLSLGTERLGRRVRDKVSGFSGTIVDAIVYMNGCVRHGVQGDYAPGEKDPMPLCYLDTGRLDDAAPASTVSVPQTRTGGPITRGKP